MADFHLNFSPFSPVVLCVDDDVAGLSLRKRILEQSGFQVITASDARVALTILEQMTVDVAVIDFEMPGMDGASLAAIIHERLCIPIVVLSGFCGELPHSLKTLCRRVIHKGEPPITLIETLHRLAPCAPLRKSEPGASGDATHFLKVA
jgi:CheY-like chemotaxis protein